MRACGHSQPTEIVTLSPVAQGAAIVGLGLESTPVTMKIEVKTQTQKRRNVLERNSLIKVR